MSSAPMLREETFVLIFSGDAKTRDLNRRLLQDIRKHRCRAEVINENSPIAALRSPERPDSVWPITEIRSV
jgi:fructoselysine-6-P-deglycase FrlB-like protein